MTYMIKPTDLQVTEVRYCGISNPYVTIRALQDENVKLRKKLAQADEMHYRFLMKQIVEVDILELKRLKKVIIAKDKYINELRNERTDIKK